MRGIRRARFVTISVTDQARARDFYTGPLGLELRTDVPMGDDPGGPRWVEVGLPDGDTYLVLSAAAPGSPMVGTFGPVWFETDDLDATYAELKANGVPFDVEPSVAEWDPTTRWAQFRDPDDNRFGLSQPAL